MVSSMKIIMESHTLTRGAHDFLPVLPTVLPGFMKFSVRDVQIMPKGICEFYVSQ
jgi:hypothetical protein